MLMAAEEHKEDRHRAAQIQQIRRNWQTAEKLRELATEFRDQAARLDGFAKAIEDLGGNEVFVDGVTKGDSALKTLHAYNTNVEVAIVKRNIRLADTKKRIRRS